MAIWGSVKAQTDIVWDFTNLKAQSFTSGQSYSFKATDGVTEMRYSAGSSDGIVVSNSSSYLKENGKTGSGTVLDIDNKTNVGKNRLIRLFVTGRGKLTITCNNTKGEYKVYDGSASGTQLIGSLSADAESSEISVKDLLWIETTVKGYITQITWSPSAPSTDPVITAADANIKVLSTEGVTQSIAIEGENLEANELTAKLEPAVDGMDVVLESSKIANGIISTKATLTYSSTIDVPKNTTTLQLTAGEYTKEITITYLAKVTYSELQTISQTATWDFGTAVSGKAELANQKEEYVYADIADFEDLTFTEAFNAEALAFKGQYAYRGGNDKYAQNGTFHFKTAYPGKVDVTFSNTGNADDKEENYRYVKVNGKQGTKETHTTTQVSESFYVEAGDVIVEGTNSLRYYKIVFTPATTFVEVGEKLYRTFASSSALDFTKPIEGLTAYAAIVEGDNVKFEPITSKVPAETGMLLKAETPGKYIILKAIDEEGKDEKPEKIDNAFWGVTSETKEVEGSIFILYADETHELGFYKTTAKTFTVNKNSAYIPADVVSEARTFISLDGETTGIDAAIVNNDKQTTGVYNLNGQRVAQPTKGLYIVNGKKVVIK